LPHYELTDGALTVRKRKHGFTSKNDSDFKTEMNKSVIWPSQLAGGWPECREIELAGGSWQLIMVVLS
jgi:hypothetical protein